MELNLSLQEITIRLIMALAMGGVIGTEREYKNRPAGLRTHMLVCLGATIIALTQVEIAAASLQQAREFPELVSVLRSDQTRLIAQIVSGVGFLGAGTIIVSNRSIKGLTTAASIWTVAGLGIAIGMGYYLIAICSFVGIILSLTVIDRVVRVHTMKKMEIRYVHRSETKEFIMNYFEENKINVEALDFDVEFFEDYRIYTNVYTVDLPGKMSYSQVMEDLSRYKNITKIRIVDI
ncbi:MgtC/SapB family protein [Enterococcus alcedinis]|uniref:Magnesium transporter MgtC n=1 Tax=Enterococcus alcedinis TaxID=1274384 RepID=A0A917JG38_9ENTE|nr:MgtC/SapB family protein [Enterococcus alcedinis]MBP2102723.1 putative Mg2+ transporter-C (MgtC) family protein [Enterococcus alcedinis]GGI66283.1 magnesium transporter MgtC [Enterococcus alcedinis]